MSQGITRKSATGRVALTVGGALLAAACGLSPETEATSESTVAQTQQPVATQGNGTSATDPDGSSNPYADAGGHFLWRIHSEFLKADKPANSTVRLYANIINGNDGTRSDQNAELWSEENMIRALYWGARVNPDRYKPLLSTAVDQTDWYQTGCGNGFGYTRGGTCFFDDNALLGGTLMNVYLHVFLTPALSEHSRQALNYVADNRDAHGGVPQKPVDKGQGLYYMNPVLRLALANVDHGVRFNNTEEISMGQSYFTQVNDPKVGLKTDSGLFKGGTRYVGPGDTWQPDDKGPLAGDSTSVAALAIALYRAGDQTKLAYAENLMDLVVARWVDPATGAVSQDAVTGGYAIVDLLCQLYQIDHKAKYYNSAKSIVDFLLNKSRDRAGYFPNGTDDDGKWDTVRTGKAPDPQTTLLTQSAAAAALLEFAYIDMNKN